MQTTTRRRVLMITGDYAEDYEVSFPYQALLLFNHDVDVVSPNRKSGDRVILAVHDSEPNESTYSERRGHWFTLNKSFDSVKPEDYDGLVLPGGRAPEYLRINKRVLDLARHFFDKNLPVAVIGHGVQVLTPTGSLKGRTVTSHPTTSPEVTLCGGTYREVDSDRSNVDGNLVSAPSWHAVGDWMRNYVTMLGNKISTSSS